MYHETELHQQPLQPLTLMEDVVEGFNLMVSSRELQLGSFCRMQHLNTHSGVDTNRDLKYALPFLKARLATSPSPSYG